MRAMRSQHLGHARSMDRITTRSTGRTTSEAAPVTKIKLGTAFQVHIQPDIKEDHPTAP